VRRTPSTRGRLSLLAMAAVAPALAIADVALLLSLSATASAEVDHDLVAQSALLQAGIDDSNGHVSFGATGGGAGPVTADAVVVRTAGVVAAAGTNPLPTAVAVTIASRATAARAPVFADASNSAGVPQRVYATPLSPDQGVAGTLVVNRSVAALQAAQTQTLLLALLISALTLLLTGLIARWLAGRVLRPVRTIAGLAQTISEKDLHRRVSVDVPEDELGELVKTFNAMLARLEADFDGLRRFTADASHELRAPLAVMRGELELSLARPRPAPDYRQSQQHLLGEVEHLTRIADRLLLLARADAGTLVAERVPVDVDDLLTETVERWRPAGRRKEVTFSADAGSAAIVSADPALLRQVLDNLVDNAVKHAPAGSVVRLSATARGGGVEFDIADRGPGVPREMRPLLFNRFFRENAARTRGETDGAGLGLAVALSIARAHGGTLSYVDTPGGALFRMWLPAEPSR
jgi:two-component system, OmpR family, sensor kinase